MLSVGSVTMYLAPPIVQSEVLNDNHSLNSAFRASHIMTGCKYLAAMLVNCVQIVAASFMVKTGMQMSSCDIGAYEKMRIPKVKV